MIINTPTRQLDEVILTATGEVRIVEEVRRRKAASSQKMKAPCIPNMNFTTAGK